MNCVFLSVSSLLYHHHPCGWLSPAKPWWSIETFGMLTPPRGHPEWRMALVSMWPPARSACFYFILCFFRVCSLVISLSFFAVHILSIWISPCIGLSSLDISMLCLLSLPQSVLSDAQDAQWNQLFLWPFGEKLGQIKETSGWSTLTCITSLPLWVLVVSHARVLCSVDRTIFVFCI